MLSPTVTSMLKGDTITRVGSTNNKENRAGGENINPVLLRNGETCRAEKDPKQSSTTAALPPELDYLQWPLRKILNATSELSHLWFYPPIPFSFCWIETLLINPPESSSSHCPDEQGEKTRLKKSAADLKGSGKIFEKAWKSEIILFESSYFKDLFHSHTLLRMVINPPILLFLN